MRIVHFLRKWCAVKIHERTHFFHIIKTKSDFPHMTYEPQTKLLSANFIFERGWEGGSGRCSKLDQKENTVPSLLYIKFSENVSETFILNLLNFMLLVQQS